MTSAEGYLDYLLARWWAKAKALVAASLTSLSLVAPSLLPLWSLLLGLGRPSWGAEGRVRVSIRLQVNIRIKEFVNLGWELTTLPWCMCTICRGSCFFHLKTCIRVDCCTGSCQVWGSAVGTLCVACRIQETELGFLSPPYLVKIWQAMALPVLQSNHFFMENPRAST